MHSHILIPVALDHEGQAKSKIALAKPLLADGGRITLLTDLEDVSGFVSEFVTLKPINHLSDRIKTNLDAIAEGHDEISTEAVHGKAGMKVSEYTRSEKIDLTILGSHSPPGHRNTFLAPLPRGLPAARPALSTSCGNSRVCTRSKRLRH